LIENCNTKKKCSQGVHLGASENSGVKFVSGIILKSKAMAFERMLFRATRGNMFFNQAPAGEPVTDPISGEEV
jgi:V-type H+-transporting ATPase subunit a